MMSSTVLAIVLQTAPVVPQQSPDSSPSCERFGHALFGSIVCAPGDVDGDGVPDMILADPCYESERGTARAWLLSGKDRHVLFTRPLDGYAAGSSLLVINVNDANGDGVGDWVLSPSWFAGRERAVAAIVSGKDGAILRELRPDGTKDAVSNAPITGRAGHALPSPLFPPEGNADVRGGDERLDVGDLDGDGTRDYVIRRQETTGKSFLNVLSGKSGTLIRRIECTETYRDCQGFGNAMVAMGDLDGDGFTEVAVAAPDAGVAEGAVQVISPETGVRLFTFQSDLDGWHWGQRLAALGDIDGDGACDLAIASDHTLSHYPGRARIASGKDGHTLFTFVRKGDEILVLPPDSREPGSKPAPAHK